jgi:hypothetical protein
LVKQEVDPFLHLHQNTRDLIPAQAGIQLDLAFAPVPVFASASSLARSAGEDWGGVLLILFFALPSKQRR